MEIRTIKENSSVTMVISGRIDTNAARELNKCIDENVPGIEELIIDLQDTPYISSAGLRVLLNARKIMQSQGSMKVIHVQSDVMDIFDMTGFTGLFNLE